MGLDGQALPRLCRGHRHRVPRPRPPGADRGGLGAGAAGAPRLKPLLHPAAGAARADAHRALADRQGARAAAAPPREALRRAARPPARAPPSAAQVFFCNSGAEANEAAIKLARKHARTTRGVTEPVILSAKKSFHGRTLATIAATGQAKYQEPFLPMPVRAARRARAARIARARRATSTALSLCPHHPPYPSPYT